MEKYVREIEVRPDGQFSIYGPWTEYNSMTADEGSAWRALDKLIDRLVDMRDALENDPQRDAEILAAEQFAEEWMKNHPEL